MNTRHHLVMRDGMRGRAAYYEYYRVGARIVGIMSGGEGKLLFTD